MENHSRSASPREGPRPQHRPPSPPTPPTVPTVPIVPSAPTAPSAFDNRAYQHDEADPNHNDSFTSNIPQNGHSKEPNGETKTPEAVNLELINLTPKNGKAKKKDVELDMNSANPYDEYFVSVNEHRKYMRGEKLYVTADKRGDKGGCKRPLCWTLLALVVAAVIALIVLAATGILTSSSPTAVENYNSSVSSARAFGGLTPSKHDRAHDRDHEHDHEHDHDHTHDHDHDAHDGHDHTGNASNEADVAQNDEDVPALEESNESAMYVPRTLEGQLRIDNEEYTQALSDSDSEEYHQFIATLGDELRRTLFNRSMLEDSNNDINVQVIELRNGSIIVTYRVHWKPKFGFEDPKDLMTASSLKSNLDKYLGTNGRMISIYHIAEDKMQASNVLDLCHINNNDCSHGCVFDEKSLDFICTCPRGQILDMHNPKNCISIFDYSDQIQNQGPKKEVKGLEVSSNPETKEISPNPISVNIAEHEHTIDWKDNEPASDESTTETDNGITHFSHVFGHPEEPEPSSKPKSNGESEHIWEPKPTSEPESTAKPNSEPELATEPKAEPQPSAEPKVEHEIFTEPKSQYEHTVEPKAEPEPTAEPKSEPESIVEPISEPEPTTEPKAEPEPTAEPKTEPEPFAEPQSEPESTVEPKAAPEPTAERNPEPEPTAEPKSEPEPTTEPNVKLEPTTEAKIESEHAAEPKSEPALSSELDPEPQPTAEPNPEPEPTAEPKPVSESAADVKPTTGQQRTNETEPTSTPKPKPNGTQEPIPEAKPKPEPNVLNSQKELAIEAKILPDFTAEPITSTSTAEHASEPEPTFMPSLAGILGVEPELVFLQDSDNTEDTQTVIQPTANHTVMVIHQPLSETVSERNMSSDEMNLEGKPTDYFNILKQVDHQMPETVDTTTPQGSIVHNETVENNSVKKDPAFFSIFQQDNEPVTDITLKSTTAKNITDKSDIESTTTMEYSLDALHEQVYKNVMGEIPEKTRKIKDHRLFNDMSSTIKPDNQTTDENFDPLLSLLSDKSMSESTTAYNKMPSNTTTKEDFILGPLIEATTVKAAKEPTESVMKENNTKKNISGPLIEAATVIVAKAPTEADKISIYISPVTEKSKISYVLDDGTFFNTKDTKQTEPITGLEPATESFLTENENNTETQEVGANSEKRYGLNLPNFSTTESDIPEPTEITFNMLLNRSSKAIIDSDNTNQVLINMKMSSVNDTTTTESEWLSEPVTEISYEQLINRMDNQLTTESSANAVAKVINGGQINDFEPDYLMHLSPTYAPEPNEMLYTMSDYDSQEARVKRVNKDEKVSKIANDMKPEINRSSSHIDGPEETIETFEIPKENKNYDTYMEQNTSMNESMKKFTMNTVNEYIYRTTEKQQSEPAPVWEESDVERDTSTKKILAGINKDKKKIPTTTILIANSNNNTQENFNQETASTQISNLNVTIYEKPINQSLPLTTTKSPALHSAEYDEHEKETNPFLPEVENNNSLVKKLQEGHDLEPSNLNDTQNDNTNEQSALVLDTSKSHNKSSVNVSSIHQIIPAATTEKEDSFDDLLREISREHTSNSTELGTHGGDENINEDGLALSTFLLDTDDLDILTHKSTDSESTSESDFTTNSPEAENEDYLSVVPVSFIGKSSKEKEVNKKKFKSENIEEINDIVVDFSHKKSDKRTFNELNTSKKD